MDRLLIIDDDPEICLLLSRFLTNNNYEVEIASNGRGGLKLIKEKQFDGIITDFRLPDLDGFDLIKQIKKLAPNAPLFVITGYSDVRLAVKAIKMGVSEYVTKPIQPDELLLALKDGLSRSEENHKESEVNNHKQTAKSTSNKTALSENLQVIWGQHPKSKAVKQSVELIAPTSLSVIITGETGTGKEITARSIHRLSERKNAPFIAIDCGALPSELAGSELFGHVKGAFTGAHKDKKGVFERANGGTLFLDEIGNLSYKHQIQLLRAIQEREIRPLGGDKTILVDVRIIVASNEVFSEKIRSSKFREDLYFRLNEFQISLPPLREIATEIPLYVNHFLSIANKRLNKEVEGFDAASLAYMQSYPWYGNLRELKNVVQRSALVCQSNFITPEHLPEAIKTPALINDTDELELELEEFSDLKSVAEHAERIAITKTLKRTQQNKSKTAELLGIDRKTLYNKMKQLGID